MKKTILTVLFAGLFSSGYAQEKALLYEVAGKDIVGPSYLYGTFHMLCPADLQLSAATKKALADSRQVYLEIDLDQPGVQASMLTAMMMEGGKTMKDLMKTEDYAVLDAYMQRTLGAGLSQMGMLKPVALSSFLMASMLKCEPGSLDLTLAQLATADGKEVLGLETLEQQMATLDTVPLADQIKGLVDVARQPDEAMKEVASLVEAYKAQDLPQLMKLMNDSKFSGEVETFQEELLDKRNRNWIPMIEKAAHDKPTFFAFGAGHLGGPNGVISLLRQKGYTVKAVQ